MNKAFVLFFVALVVSSCVTAAARPPAPQMSQLEIRQLQTREFPKAEVLDGMKAVSAALQDEGYTIDSVNTDLGLITGTKVLNDEDSQSKQAQIFWYGFAKDYRAARQWKATANIQNVVDNLRIRISIAEQELNETGGVIYSQPVSDQEFYQAIFSKVSKSVFLQKNKL